MDGVVELTERVHKAALEGGAALVGFAPVERFEGAPPDLHPRTILAQTRTVIAVSCRQPRGAQGTSDAYRHRNTFRASLAGPGRPG
jgi:hypothetical protein